MDFIQKVYGYKSRSGIQALRSGSRDPRDLQRDVPESRNRVTM
jgi:hypothetical protein